MVARAALPSLEIEGDAQFVEELYHPLLGRSPDPEDFRLHLEVIRRGRAIREQVLTAILDSDEYRRRFQDAP